MTASRRSFLLGTGATAAAAALVTPGAARADNVVGGGRPDPEARRFTLAVIPDTQYMFDLDRGDPAPLKATLQYLIDHRKSENIVFVSHLGDLVENGRKSEIDDISERFEVLDRRRVGYSVLAGNHDLPDSRTDDQRGRTPYLDRFGPQRFRTSPTFRGASADGYNSFHVFRAGGQEWLVLALDWRMSAKGFEWARSVLRQHAKLPVILTTHELVQDGGDGAAVMSDYGRRLWDELIKDNDQIFLALNGHFWPPARATLRNTAGNDVHVHITNYQDRYYGGGTMIRLYHFDLDRKTIDVRTLSPWLLGFSYETAGLNAWASALVLGLVSVVAVLSYAEWEEWLDLALGVWILGSPWVLNFPADSAATKVHVMIGLIVTVLAVAELWKEHTTPPQVTT